MREAIRLSGDSPRRFKRSGADQSRDSPTGGRTGLLRLDADDFQARPGQMQRGRLSGQTTANDSYVTVNRWRLVGHYGLILLMT